MEEVIFDEYNNVMLVLPQKNLKQSALIERNNGDIMMREGKHELAIKHYNASLSWLKLMFEEKIFTNEKEALLFVQKIGVNIKYN